MSESIRIRLSAHGALDHFWLDTDGLVDEALQVVIIGEGEANGLFFDGAVLERGAERFAGAPVFVDHAGAADLGRPGGRSIRDLVGVVLDPWWDYQTRCVRARLALASSSAWLRTLIRDLGPYPSLFGLSADLWLRRDASGEPPHPVTEIDAVNSVDIVVRPAAGGRFVRSESAQTEKETPMSHDPDAIRVQTALQDSTPPETPPAPAPVRDPRTPDAPAAPEPLAVPRDHIVALAVAAHHLPEHLEAIVRENEALQSAEQIERFCQSLADGWAQANAQPSIQHLGQISQMRSPMDRITLAFERLMGVGDTADHRNAPRLSGLRELYDTLTGDYERHGIFRPERVALANATTTTMAQVTANVLNKVMLQAFESRGRWWAPIAYEEDFPTLQDTKWVTLGGFSDLDTVAEGGAYQEKTWDDYAETAAFVKKGNYIGLTLEMIDRDDIGAVRAIPRKLGHAAWRTLSSSVSALFTTADGAGPNLADGNPLFDTVNHDNAGTSALDATSWHATVVAMFQQQEYHSSKPLGIRPSFCLVPIELEKTAVDLFTTQLEPGLAGNTRAIEQVSHSVITVPEWTDANNWAAAAHPNDLPGVVVGYRFGRAPELFVADHPLMGSMFTNDEMRVKCRFVFAVGIGDYRALYKHNVA